MCIDCCKMQIVLNKIFNYSIGTYQEKLHGCDVSVSKWKLEVMTMQCKTLVFIAVHPQTF